MSLYSDYLKELDGKQIIETDEGFVTYQFCDGGECYIVDIYVVPEKRKTNIASKFATLIESIARSKGCKYLTGSVVPSNKGSSGSAATLIAYGFKILRSEKNLIWFVKEL